MESHSLRKKQLNEDQFPAIVDETFTNIMISDNTHTHTHAKIKEDKKLQMSSDMKFRTNIRSG